MNPELLQRLFTALSKDKHRFATLRVLTALGPFFRRDTGELLCSKETLAKTAQVSHREIDYALVRLVELGVLVQEEGIYYVQPDDTWLCKETGPKLTLVDGGRPD